MAEKIIIGLFGTCGDSEWRDEFIQKYNELGISFFNPQVDGWVPEYAPIEAEHLANDKIILFPITSESYGLGSLSEVGFSILNAIKLDSQRNFVVLIEEFLDTELTDEKMITESIKDRALVKQHLLKLRLSNVYYVETLTDMLRVSIVLHTAETIKQEIQKFSIAKINSKD